MVSKMDGFFSDDYFCVTQRQFYTATKQVLWVVRPITLEQVHNFTLDKNKLYEMFAMS